MKNCLIKALEKFSQHPQTGQTVLGGVYCKYHLSDSSRPLIVTFSHANNFIGTENVEDPDASPWGYDYLLKYKFNAISFSCINKNTWYREDDFHDEIKELAPYIQSFNTRLGYGASMGAFGVGAFASILKLDRVLLLNPISTLNKSLAPFETRFKPARASLDWSNQFHDGANFECPGLVVFDPIFNLDHQHCNRYNSKVRKVKLAGVGHGVAIHLLRLGVLKKLFFDFVNDSYDTDFYSKEFRKRKLYPPYYRWLLSDENTHLTAKRKEIILKHFEAVQGYLGDEYYVYRKTMNLIRDAALALEQTNPELSVKLLEEAVRRRPDGPFIKKKLKELSMSLKALP